MSDHQDSGLFAIDIDAEDYAETAAGDTPSTVPRTFQSAADFARQQASYTAKIDTDNLQELLKAVPVLADDTVPPDESQVKLDKKSIHLLGYAVGEMYYNRQYSQIVELCILVRHRCQIDGKTAASLDRWTERCSARLRH